MEVYQIKLKVYLLRNIPLEEVQSKISGLIDSALAKDKKLLEFHNKHDYKHYCFDYFYPSEMDKVYHEGKIYTVTIRTISKELERFFTKTLVNESNQYMKALSYEARVLPQKHIAKIYSLSPAVMKNDTGYWRSNMTVEEFERRLKENLIKKYNSITNEKLDEDFPFYDSIEFKNRKPVPTVFKNIKLLGDKISLMISDNEKAQEIAYLSLGTGILENNARGFGFCNFRWL